MADRAERARRPLRFVLVGVLNTAIDIALFLLLTAVGVAVLPANMISTGVALAVSFLVNRSYTFRSDGAIAGQAVRFLIVTLVGLWVLQPVAIWLLLGWFETWMPETAALLAAKLAATVLSLTWNYLLYGAVVFRPARRDREAGDR